MGTEVQAEELKRRRTGTQRLAHCPVHLGAFSAALRQPSQSSPSLASLHRAAQRSAHAPSAAEPRKDARRARARRPRQRLGWLIAKPACCMLIGGAAKRSSTRPHHGRQAGNHGRRGGSTQPAPMHLHIWQACASKRARTQPKAKQGARLASLPSTTTHTHTHATPRHVVGMRLRSRSAWPAWPGTCAVGSHALSACLGLSAAPPAGAAAIWVILR